MVLITHEYHVVLAILEKYIRNGFSFTELRDPEF